MKNIIVGQSGGPTAVINGSLYGVVTEGLRQTDAIETVFGMINGCLLYTSPSPRD